MGLDYYLQLFGVIALAAFILLSVFAVSALAAGIKALKKAVNSVSEVANDIKVIAHKADSFIGELSGIRVKVESAVEDISALNRKAVQSLEELSNVMNSLVGAVDDFHLTSTQIRSSTMKIDEKVENFGSIIKPFKLLSDVIFTKIAPPLTQTATLISAVSKGINAFSYVFHRKKH